MKKKLEELKARLDALKSRIEADDAEAIAEGLKIKGEIEATEAAIKTAEEKAALLGLIGRKPEKDDETTEVKAHSLGEHFVKSMPKTHGDRFAISAKAYNDPLEIGTPGSPQVPRQLVTDIDRNIVQ